MSVAIAADPLIFNSWSTKVDSVASIMKVSKMDMMKVLDSLIGPEGKGSIYEDQILSLMIRCHLKLDVKEHSRPRIKEYVEKVMSKFVLKKIPSGKVDIFTQSEDFASLEFTPGDDRLVLRVHDKTSVEFLEAEILPKLFAEYMYITSKYDVKSSYFYLGGAGIIYPTSYVQNSPNLTKISCPYYKGMVLKFVRYCNVSGHGSWRNIPLKINIPELFTSRTFEWTGRPVVCLDIDETLVYARDISFGRVSVIPRPGLKEFIKEVNEKYDIVIYTAALPEHADNVLLLLDPYAEWSFRRLYRQDCVSYEIKPNSPPILVKDLRILNIPLEKVIMIDNTPHVAAFQPTNLYLIEDYLGEKEDNRLEIALKTINKAFSQRDVRDLLGKIFHLNSRYIV